MAINYNKSNPRLETNVTGGDKGAHSSLEKSVAPLDHAQSDDRLQDVPPPQDPNISGMTPTEDVHTWMAGPLSAWQENDDYRDFFEHGASCVAESATTHRYNTVHDGDYDDNRGHPTALGHSHGRHGPAGDETMINKSRTEPNAQEFPLGPVIQRRI
jgi:hypothetical protein